MITGPTTTRSPNEAFCPFPCPDALFPFPYRVAMILRLHDLPASAILLAVGDVGKVKLVDAKLMLELRVAPGLELVN